MSHISTIKRGTAAVLALWLGMTPFTSAWATDVLYSNWLDKITFGGDLRLRHDALLATSNGHNLDRERFRLRYGFEAVAGDITAIFRMASGTGSQVSVNQTEQNLDSQKALYIDLAYLKYKPLDIVTLQGGRMVNPFWENWSSSLVWDPDLNTEGYAQVLNLPMGVYATFAQLPLNNSSSFSDANPWMFGERIGAKANLTEDIRASLSATDYGFTHEKQFTLGAPTNNFGNSRAAGNILTSSFNELQFDGELAGRVGDLPLSLQAGYVTNTEEQNPTAGQNRGRDGYIFGLVAGKASKAKTWEAAYFYKYLRDNAVVADMVDDDFGPGGTNLAGHIVWAAYNVRDNVQFKLTYYNTHVLDQTLAEANFPNTFTASQKYYSHIMFDVLVKI